MISKAHLKKIEFLGGVSYLIVVNCGKSESTTICHVKNTGGSAGDNVDYIDFDSDEFRGEVMRGKILVREFSSVIIEFHKHVQGSLDKSPAD